MILLLPFHEYFSFRFSLCFCEFFRFFQPFFLRIKILRTIQPWIFIKKGIFSCFFLKRRFFSGFELVTIIRSLIYERHMKCTSRICIFIKIVLDNFFIWKFFIRVSAEIILASSSFGVDCFLFFIWFFFKINFSFEYN